MKKIVKLTLLLVFVTLASCQKYLEKPNKLQSDIQTVDQLEALINNAPLFYQETNASACYSTDDMELTKQLITAYPTLVTATNLLYYVWDVNNLKNLASDELWSGEFKKIFTANVVLSTIDGVTGTTAQKNKIKADAYFIRAISNWALVNHYCLPYSAENLGSLGIPLKKSTIYTEDITRANLKESYDAILQDIEAARSLLPDNDVVATLRWRVSQRAIDAFLSRFYLFTGEYGKSIQFANNALASATSQLVDLNTIGAGVPSSYASPAATLNYSALNDWAANRFLYWNEFYYTRYTYTANQMFIPSQSLLGLYDSNNDMRYRLFMIPNGGRRFNIISPAQFRYTYFNDGRFLPSGPTVAEVLLNKAEAQMRLGMLGDALGTVNRLRQKRLRNYVELTASNNAEGLVKILEERRRELPFSFRWVDIRRFSVNEDASDDIALTRDFLRVNASGVELNTSQIYNLPVKSLRYAVPINSTDIANSQGQLQQNVY